MSEVLYDDLKVAFDQKETPESHLLLVHLPEGFERHNIGAKVEFDYGRVRVFGELPPEKNVIKRFNQVYQVPETCDIKNIKGKVEGRIVTITMRKMEISKVITDQKPQPVPAQEAPKTQVQELKPKLEQEQDNKDHDDDTPPEPHSDEQEDQRDQRSKYQEEEPTSDKEEDQKDKYQEEEPTSDKEEDQNGAHQEGFSKLDSKSRTEYNKEESDTKTSTQPTEAKEFMPEMDQKGVTPEATSKDAHRDEKSTWTPTTHEKEENPKEEETKEIDGENNFEPEKQHDISNKKRKASSVLDLYLSESTAKRMATILEDKQKLIFMGAAIAVVVLGVYVSYSKIRSSARH